MKKNFTNLLWGSLFIGVGFGMALLIYIIFFSQNDESLRHQTFYDFISRGDEYYEQQRYSEALSEYELAIQKDNKNAIARLRLGQLYQLKNRYSEAQQELTYAHQLDPDNTEVLFRLGVIYYELRYWPEAQTHFEKLLGLLEDSKSDEREKAHLYLAHALLWQSLFDQAKSHYEQVVYLNGQNEEARYYLAMIVSREDIP